MDNGQAPFYIKLINRGLIIISGHDRFRFLQGLITNDVELLKAQSAIYACLLTPNGKFLFDFFISEDEDKLLIECEGGTRAEDLLKRLTMFKLRADVNFEIDPEKNVYALLPSSYYFEMPFSYSDPRHPQMGWRCLKKPNDMDEALFEIWDKHRLKLKIPDGSRDMIPQKSTLLECGIDHLNGVSFDKGCYMGQELTARMHYRGLTKKELVCVEFQDMPPDPFTDIKDENGKLIGEMRSSCGDVGLALIKKDLRKRFEQLNICTILA